MSFTHYKNFSDAHTFLSEKYAEESDDPAMQITLLLAVPSIATIGNVMSILYWAKGYKLQGALTIEEGSALAHATPFAHYTIKVSVKLEYAKAILLVLYSSQVSGFLYTE